MPRDAVITKGLEPFWTVLRTRVGDGWWLVKKQDLE